MYSPRVRTLKTVAHRMRRQCFAQSGAALLRNHANVQLPLARAVEFAEEDALPTSKSQLSCFDEYKLAAAHENRFDVRVGVAFGVLVAIPCRDQSVERGLDVSSNQGIGVFVHGDAGRRVRNVQIADAPGYTRALDHVCDREGDVNELRAASGGDAERFHEAYN